MTVNAVPDDCWRCITTIDKLMTKALLLCSSDTTVTVTVITEPLVTAVLWWRKLLMMTVFAEEYWSHEERDLGKNGDDYYDTDTTEVMMNRD